MTAFSYELEHRYDVAPTVVFDAFGDPESLRQWWCPPGFASVLAEIDFRVGGRYRIGMRKAEADSTLFVSGEYLEIERPSRLVFTHGFERTPAAAPMRAVGLWGAKTRVTLCFAAHGDGTLLRLLHDLLPSQEAAARLRGGFGGITRNLGAFVSRKEHPS